MKSTNVTDFPEEIISAIFREIPIIHKSVEIENNERQFFLKASKIFEAEPGETVIRRGEFDSWVYFLLSGQLQVYPEFADKQKNLVNYISPGEMFGELSFIRDLNRNATLVADENSKRIIFLGTDFSAFGDIDDFRAVSITTKIIFHRLAVRITRKRLEALNIDYPDNELVIKSPTFKRYAGEKNTLRELLYLKDQAEAFARHLNRWNRSLEIDANYHSTRGQIPIEQIKSMMSD